MRGLVGFTRPGRDSDGRRSAVRVGKLVVTPMGKVAAAALVAIGGAIGIALWNYSREVIRPTPAIRVNVQTNPALWNDATANSGWITYVVPLEPRHLKKPPSEESWDWQPWIHRLGGVNSRTSIQLTIEGRNKSQVLVQGIWAHAVRRRPPLKGTAISRPVGGASPDRRSVELNLDTGRPDSFYDPMAEAKPGAGTRPFGFALAPGELGVIYVDAHSKKSLVTWKLKVAVVANGKTEIKTIDDHGKPFETTSDRGAPLYVWYDNRWMTDSAFKRANG